MNKSLVKFQGVFLASSLLLLVCLSSCMPQMAAASTPKTTEEVADKALDMAQQFADKVGTLTERYGPQAYGAALEVARISAIQDLAKSLIGFVILAMCWFGYRRVHNIAERQQPITEAEVQRTYGLSRSDIGKTGMAALCRRHEGAMSAWMCVTAVGVVIGLLVTLLFGLDIWAWVGVFQPDIYIAHKLLKL